MELGNKLKELRTANNMSLEELGERVGVTKQALSKYELNAMLPTILVLKNIAKVFNITIDELVN